MSLHEQFLRLFLDARKAAALLGDLEEEAARLGASRGWVRRQALRCALSAGWLAAVRTPLDRAVTSDRSRSGVTASGLTILIQDLRYGLRRIRRQPGFTVVSSGLVVGLAAALVGARYVQALLFNVPASDVTTFAVAPIVVLFAALVACIVPVGRAVRVDPAVALRRE